MPATKVSVRMSVVAAVIGQNDILPVELSAGAVIPTVPGEALLVEAYFGLPVVMLAMASTCVFPLPAWQAWEGN